MKHELNIAAEGKALSEADKAVIMLHGRGASAHDIISLSQYLNLGDFALLAPQATNHTWYPYSFMAPVAQNEPWLSSAIDVVGQTLELVENNKIKPENIYFLGFSQGACLATEFIARNARKYGGAAIFTGGLIGDKIYEENYKGDFKGTPVFIGTSNPDMHVPVERVYASSNILRQMNAEVTEKVYDHMGHTINQNEIDLVNQLLFS